MHGVRDQAFDQFGLLAVVSMFLIALHVNLLSTNTLPTNTMTLLISINAIRQLGMNCPNSPDVTTDTSCIASKANDMTTASRSEYPRPVVMSLEN